MTCLIRWLERRHAARTRRDRDREDAWERELVAKYGVMFTPSRTAVTTRPRYSSDSKVPATFHPEEKP